MTEIFSLEAPKYWKHGIPVMPLHVNSKRPLLNAWQQYGIDMPTEATQAHWLQKCSNNNIGLPLGPQSDIMMVDIDSTDQRIYDAIMAILPPSPWRRVGAKGCALAYKYNGNRGQKVISQNDGMIVEILSVGNQVVLPPSIHPDTLAPYQANCNLYDVLDQLSNLPVDIVEKIRAMLVNMGVELKSNAKGTFKTSDFVAEGSRDIQMTHFSGLLAYEIIKGEKTFKDGLGQLQAWCEIRVAKKDGDNLDFIKGGRKIVEFMMKDITMRGKILPPGWDLDLTPEERTYWNLDISEDQEEWNLQQTLDYMHSQFSDTEKSDPKRVETVKYVLKKMSKSQKLDEIDRGKILTVLKDQSGLGLTMSYYNKELKNLMQGPMEGDNHNQIAQDVVSHFKERDKELRYYEGNLWTFNGTHWEVVPIQQILKLISEEYGALVAAKKNNDHNGILKVIMNIVPQCLTESEVDGINFLNGFLMRDLTLVPHKPEQGMTYVMNFCYLPEEAGKCPRFFDYLHFSWGEEPDYEQRLKMLQEAMAVTLFGLAPSFQQVFLMTGNGNNGKSVLLEIVDSLVPQGAKTAIPPTEWGNSFVPAEFTGKLLNYAGELPEKMNIKGDIFKTIVTGDPITVRAPYGKAFTLRAKAAHWFAGNHLPQSKDTSNGFNRRWCIFTFNKTVPKNRRIANYGKMIVEEEVEAIVAWFVQALPELLKRQSYTNVPSSDKMVEEMAFKNAPIRSWILENVQTKPGAETPVADLYRSYWTHCIGGNFAKPPSPPAFKHQLESIMRENADISFKNDGKGEILMNFVLKKA